MSKSSIAVINWRKKTKQRIVEAMGGKCVSCGYNKCNDVLELHHINPTEKEFQLGSMRANIKSWKTIVAELRKCVLFCANCHREYHAGILEIDFNTVIKFDEYYADYIQMEKDLREETKEICPICNVNKILKGNLTCSHACAAKKSRKVNWDNVNLFELQKTMSNCAIGKMLGISDVAVGKRIKKER